VEMALKNYNIEASQGTHFFQNVTSLGVGYFSINPSAGEGIFAQDILDAMPAAFDGEWFRVVEFDKPLTAFADGRSRKGIVKVQL